MTDPAAPQQALLLAENLGHAFDAGPLFQGLTFQLGPGLHLLRGGDGRGKTTLLRLLAGQLTPQAGTVQRHARSVNFAQMGDAALNDAAALAWLQAQRAAAPGWNDDTAEALIDAFDIGPHLAKPLLMHSTGSRRKLGWVAAAASGAELTLLDLPFAALDARSCRALAAWLKAAASDARRAVVVADFEVPPWLEGVAWASHIDLGD